jgi:hypothetical protein
MADRNSAEDVSQQPQAIMAERIRGHGVNACEATESAS